MVETVMRENTSEEDERHTLQEFDVSLSRRRPSRRRISSRIERMLGVSFFDVDVEGLGSVFSLAAGAGAAPTRAGMPEANCPAELQLSMEAPDSTLRRRVETVEVSIVSERSYRVTKDGERFSISRSKSCRFLSERGSQSLDALVLFSDLRCEPLVCRTDGWRHHLRFERRSVESDACRPAVLLWF